MKKMIRLLLTLFLVIGMASTSLACGEDKSDVKAAYDKITYEGTHQLDSNDIEGKYLVKDGISDYAIVVNPNCTSYVDDARNELRLLFERATGWTLPVMFSDDESVTYSPTSKYICLGENALSTQAFNAENFTYDKEELGRDGIRIKTLGESIFILPGTSDFGVLYGVYDFLEIYFGFDHYYRNANDITVVTGDVLLKDFDVIDVPDFLNRTGCSESAALGRTVKQFEIDDGLVQQDMTYAVDRFRLLRGGSGALLMNMPDSIDDVNEPTTNNFMHNTDNIVSVSDERYGEDRYDDDWISNNGRDQLCLTARGNDEKRTNLIEHVSKKILHAMNWYSLEEDPTKNYMGIFGEDNYQNCTCPSCLEEYVEDNQSYAGTYIRFCEDVAVRVKEMLKALPDNDPRKARLETFKIVCFAYGFTKKPCTVYDSKLGRYVLADGREKMNDDVVMWVCNQYDDNVYDEIAASEEGKAVGFYADQGGAKSVAAWAQVTNELWLWDYGKYYGNPIFLYDNYSSLNSDKFQYLADLNFSMFYCQVDFHSNDQTGFESLKQYIESKLLWDSTRNTGELIDKYFKGMFGVAADIMQEAFETDRLRMNIVVNTNDFGNSLEYTNAWTKRAYWHYASMLKPQFAYFDRALEAIEVYKYSDPQKYDLIRSRILVEKLAPLFKVFNAYGDADITPFSAQERIDMLNEALYITEHYSDGVQHKTYTSVRKFFLTFV